MIFEFYSYFPLARVARALKSSFLITQLTNYIPFDTTALAGMQGAGGGPVGSPGATWGFQGLSRSPGVSWLFPGELLEQPGALNE